MISNSFFRSGFELLYTPLDPRTKRSTKAYIDVGSQRVGDMAGGGLLLALLFVLPALSISIVLGLAVVTTLGALLLVMRLHRGYVRQLASSLQSGVISLTQSDAYDATTARTLADSELAIDREELRARIRELQQRRAPTEPSERMERGGQSDPTTESLPRDIGDTLGMIADLESREPARIRDALEASRDDRRMVGHVIPLLGRFDVLDDALEFLRAVGPRCIGQLNDALADSEQPPLVRRRIPRVLETCVDRRALDGLQRGLLDPDFEVRFQCARAGVRLIAQDRSLQIPADEIYDLVQRELKVDARAWDHQGRRRRGEAGESVLLDAADYTRVNRSMEHVFTLLGLSLGPELMASALRGLFSPDANLRGTALEYLEAALPDDVRRAFEPHLHAVAPSRLTARTPADIERELMKTASAPPVDRDRMRKP